ncbi:uncharacterized protein [Aphelocoma coerulescens]|uniref:uncharacterized protein n=1 Tax=Aphelocoma coerulescens TaxID=39617 RepID=UPI00360518EF
MTENPSAKVKAAFYALLAKHNARPSPGGEEWGQNNWFNLDYVTDRVCSLQHETRFKFGRNKTIICSVLRACLAAAIDHHLKRCTEEKAIIDSLQSLVEILQKQLDEEKNRNHLLEAALKEEYFRNSKNADSPKETEEKETPHIDQIYPQKELILVKNCGENCCPRVRPLIKTEYNYINDEDFEPHITTKQIPYTAVELARLKKEYGRLPHESETEYVFRVSLTGGDQIQLTEQEASGYWGHGVFLTTGDKRGTWSLTQRAAFWAGGLNPLERGDPLAIIGTPDQLLESVHKAACLQMIHERKLTPGYESPMQLPVKPELMTPLIRGLPESLKPTAVALQKTIAAVGPVERLDRFLGNPSDQTGSTDPGFTPYSTPSQPPGSQLNSPAGDRKVWTWSEVAKDLIDYSRKYGPIKIPEEKLDKTKGVRYIRAPHGEKPENVKQISNRQHWWLLGIKKGVPRDVMDGLPLDKLSKVVSNWHCRKPVLPNPSVQPSAPLLPQNLGSESDQPLPQSLCSEPKQPLPQNQGN